MTHDQLLFEALAHWRYRGADRPSLRTYLRYHEELRHPAKEDDAALKLLERREELHGAVNRLRAGGLITVKKDAFAMTTRARDLMAKVESRCGRSVMDHWAGLQRLLECPCCGVGLRRVNWRYRITEDCMQAAVDAYLKRSAG